MAVRLVRLPGGCSATTSMSPFGISVVEMETAVTGCTYRPIYSFETRANCRYDCAQTRNQSTTHGYEHELRWSDDHSPGDVPEGGSVVSSYDTYEIALLDVFAIVMTLDKTHWES